MVIEGEKRSSTVSSSKVAKAISRGRFQAAIAKRAQDAERGGAVGAEDGVGAGGGVAQVRAADRVHVFRAEIAVPDQVLVHGDAGVRQRLAVSLQAPPLVLERDGAGGDGDAPGAHGDQVLHPHLRGGHVFHGDRIHRQAVGNAVQADHAGWRHRECG